MDRSTPLDLLTDRFRFWEEIHPRQGKPGHQNRRVVSAIERVNIMELTFIEEGSLFLRVFVPKNIFPKTEPVREQVHDPVPNDGLPRLATPDLAALLGLVLRSATPGAKYRHLFAQNRLVRVILSSKKE